MSEFDEYKQANQEILNWGLADALRDRDYTKAEEQIMSGADIDFSIGEYTLLSMYVRVNYFPVIKFLIDHGANINIYIQTEYERIPIIVYAAFYCGDKRIFNCLYTNTTKINLEVSRSADGYLLHAVFEADVDKVKNLLLLKPQIEEVTNKGRNCISIAKGERNYGILKILLEYSRSIERQKHLSRDIDFELLRRNFTQTELDKAANYKIGTKVFHKKYGVGILLENDKFHHIYEVFFTEIAKFKYIVWGYIRKAYDATDRDDIYYKLLLPKPE